MKRWPVALATLVLLVAAACSGDEDAEPAPDPAETTSTAVVDRSGIALAPVGGVTTSTVRETGSARLVGTVRGPAGPVAGATVRVERFVAGGERRTDVLTGPDGRFVLEGVPGGRYRVRAFLPPRLALVEAEVRFLADGAEHEFDLVVEEHSGLVVRSSAAPSPATVGSPVNLVVLVAERRVDGDGIVRTAPVSGAQVELVGLSRWSLRFDGGASSGASTSTDGSGRARWELRCDAPGDPGLAVRIPVTVSASPPAAGPADPAVTSTTAAQTRLETVALELAACVAAPSTTTTTTSSSESTTTTVAVDEDG